MSKILVKTGFGYIKDASDNIVAKAELPPGEHSFRDGYIYVEVTSRAELDQVQVFIDPAQLQAAKNEQLIQQKLRELAIIELTKEGKWPG